MTDPVIKEMIEAGAMHQTQAPFDESENEFKEEVQEINLPHTLKCSD